MKPEYFRPKQWRIILPRVQHIHIDWLVDLAATVPLYLVTIFLYKLLVTRALFQTTYKIVNLGPLKSSLLNKLHIFQSMGKIFHVEFQRAPYIDSFDFYTILKIQELSYSRARRHFWNVPWWCNTPSSCSTSKCCCERQIVHCLLPPLKVLGKLPGSMKIKNSMCDCVTLAGTVKMWMLSSDW